MQRPQIQHPAAKMRADPERTASWPPTATRPSPRLEPESEVIQIPHSAPSAPLPIQRPSKPAAYDPLFEDDLNRHPENHFLSPVQMYEYQGWADSDDEDDDEEEFVHWDAGITDFSLFNDERRRAAERNEELPDRWRGVVASQAAALQRAVQRNQASSNPSQRRWVPLHDDLPQLTPDSSPDLRGNLTMPPFNGRKEPTFRPFKVTPPQEDDDLHDYDDYEEYDDDSDDSDDDDLPVAWLVERARERRRVARQLEKPGMRFARTLSGKLHVWRRPSVQIYDVDEDAEAETRAELSHQQDELTRSKELSYRH